MSLRSRNEWALSCPPLLAVGVLIALLTPACTLAATGGFNSGFLRQVPGQPNDAGALALQALHKATEITPGRYQVQVLVNLEPAGAHLIDFSLNTASGQLQPCLSAGFLDELGLRLDAMPPQEIEHQACIDLPATVPDARVNFDSRQLQLALSIPQIAMHRDRIGYIDPARWDSGINAAFISYQASTTQGSNRYRSHYSNHDLFLTSGLNLGDWRLRSTQSWRSDSEGARQWQRAQTYAQRDLPGTRANLTLGETFTDSEVFRGIPVTGVRIASDMSMLPDSQQSYAPVIRGVAQSRAKLEVQQNGYPIYTTYVSPGPYVIDDLASASSGELEIILTEDDGQVRRFTQPYASIGNLMREDVWRYSATLGRYNPASALDDPLLLQATLAMGMSWNASLYGGLMTSEYYRAASLGLSKDLGSIGAVALDVTRAQSDIDTLEQRQVSGQSYAVKYGKTFANRTNLRFTGYRYSTEGYRDFDEAVRQRSRESTFNGSRRSRLEVSLNQGIGQRSSLSLMLTQQDFWHRNDIQRQYQLSFSTHHHGINYNFNASQSLTRRAGSDRQFGLSVSIPLNFGRSSNATYDVRHSATGYAHRAALSGTVSGQPLTYSASLSHNENHQSQGAVSLGYQGPQATLGAGLTEGGDYRNLSLNASGALLIHGEGLVLAPYIGDTAALIEVPGIVDVGVQHNNAARTNANGFTVVPHLRPYRINSVVLDTDRIGPEVEIDNGTTQVVPRRGSVVKARFTARNVRRLVLTVLDTHGQPLPFGAQVVDLQGEIRGIIGQAGQVMLSANTDPERLTISWGVEQVQHCMLHVDPEAMSVTEGYRLQTLTCA